MAPPAEQSKMRAPICCVLGHVDTGKTKLLDAMRQTSVQEGEAGGITQQIGATHFPVSALREKTQKIKHSFTFTIPGLLIIDTPGHESFSNLRARGSSLCNMAILVVDLMHGIEPQTRESLMLLRNKKTPFVVALNKIDRLYAWKSNPTLTFKESLEQQSKDTRQEFETRLADIIVQFAEEGMNAELSCRNKNIRKNVTLVPTSAISGDGIGELVLVACALLQKTMSKSLSYSSIVECTVLEVKTVDGLGMTIDVILSNGRLSEGDTIVLGGINGPIVTTIRAILTPQPMKELRVKSQYVHCKTAEASLGLKIAAPALDGAIAGSRLVVASTEEEVEAARQSVISDFESVFNAVSLSMKGISVQASTLGSLEALLSFLGGKSVACMRVGLGTLYKKDILPSTHVEKEHAVVLCFDVKIDAEAVEAAKQGGVTILSADIIYNLFDMFCEYQARIKEEKKRSAAKKLVFPCIVQIQPGCVFNKKDPIIIGVDVLEGELHVGTPLCLAEREDKLFVGRVLSIERNHQPQTKTRGSAAIKIEVVGGNTPMVGRHFDEKDRLYSRITREAIDILKRDFRDELKKEDWALIKNKLKPLLSIP
eukprot:GHVN01000204.1.p1 GENE.GHVN01000204.1~~GHVN01000204.1.p1  ORF type:complete len:650 (+),score=71.00 GHVN01000204.1:163-1950(+)